MEPSRFAFRRWRPRSLKARQLTAASISLVAFLMLAGFALDRAFAETAEANLRQRLTDLWSQPGEVEARLQSVVHALEVLAGDVGASR